MNLIRYFGVLGPNSNLRRKVVKKTERKTKEKKGRRYTAAIMGVLPKKAS